MSNYRLRPMEASDYPKVMALLERIEGVCLREADSLASITRYLERNPGTSFIAEADGEAAGCIFAGHDGRRGYLYHLAVRPSFRRLGIGRALVTAAAAALAAGGIQKLHIDVLASNADGAGFWRAIGWHERSDISRFSIVLSGGCNC